MLKNLSLIALSVLLCAPAFAEERRSNVLNEECPELFLETEMVQGPRLTQDDFDRKVVLFVFYQRDCNGCEREAMPRLQEIYEKWDKKPCVLVVAINTAFDKSEYPYLADVEQTRKHLKRMGWTMPVFRDLDEQSNALFTIDEISGTPQAVVLDVDGTVRAHDWFSEKDEMDRVEREFDRLASRLNCDCIPMPREVVASCKPARDAIKEGEYARAYDLANTIYNSYGYTDEDKADAEYLREFVSDVARDRVERTRESFDYDPQSAVDKAQAIIEDFNGVPAVRDLTDEVAQWRESDTLKDFVKLKDEVVVIDERIGEDPEVLDDDDRKEVIEKLAEIRARAEGTAIADLADERIAGLTRGDDAAKPDDKVDDDKASGDGARRPGSSSDHDDSRRDGREQVRPGRAEGGSADGATDDSSRDERPSGIRSHRSHR